MQRQNLPYVCVPTEVLISFLVCAFSWQVTAMMFFARCVLGPDLLGPYKELAAFTLSVASSVYYYKRGRSRLRQYSLATQGKQPYLTRGQTILVIVLIVAEAALGTLLFVHEGRIL